MILYYYIVVYYNRVDAFEVIDVVMLQFVITALICNIFCPNMQ